MHEIKCSYCDRFAIAPDIIITPPLCAHHHDVAILISRAQRFNLDVTAETLANLMQRATCRNWTIDVTDIPELMSEML